MATGAKVPPQAQETRQEKTERQGMGTVKDSQDRTLTLGTVKLGFFDCEETRVRKKVQGGEGESHAEMKIGMERYREARET